TMKQLKACVRANLQFYRRNNLLVIFMYVLMFIVIASMVPSLFNLSNTKSFSMIKRFMTTLNGAVYYFTVAVGLLTLSAPIRKRSLKLVLTKPCKLWTWILSHYVAVLGLSALLYAGISLLGSALFLMSGLPLQDGLLFVPLDYFCRTAIVFSVTLFLTSFIHPLIAVVFIVFLNDSILYKPLLFIKAGLQSMEPSSWRTSLQGLKYVVQGLYLMMPNYAPFSRKTKGIYKSFNVPTESWIYLAGSLAYALIVGAFCFLLIHAILNYRNLT
ncbi:MAG: hypothetical protein ABEJ65_12420, partial [bacterium]